MEHELPEGEPVELADLELGNLFRNVFQPARGSVAS